MKKVFKNCDIYFVELVQKILCEVVLYWSCFMSAIQSPGPAHFTHVRLRIKEYMTRFITGSSMVTALDGDFPTEPHTNQSKCVDS